MPEIDIINQSYTDGRINSKGGKKLQEMFDKLLIVAYYYNQFVFNENTMKNINNLDGGDLLIPEEDEISNIKERINNYKRDDRNNPGISIVSNGRYNEFIRELDDIMDTKGK